MLAQQRPLAGRAGLDEDLMLEVDEPSATVVLNRELLLTQFELDG